jgi:hypothetical protein
MRWATCLLLTTAVTCTMSACNRIYLLPGHEDGNLRHPPDITMRPGERRKAITTGMTLFVLVPAWMESSDPDIVEVQLPDKDTAYLVAHRPGVATVRYRDRYDGPNDPPNVGFEVRVVPEDSGG